MGKLTHSLIFAALTGLSVSAVAADAPATPSPHTLTGNVGLFSQYIYREITQTNEKPALQGGFDAENTGYFIPATGKNNGRSQFLVSVSKSF